MILHIMTKNNNIYHLRVVEVPEEKLLALKWVQLGPKRGQKEVLSHFFVQNALDFADAVYYDQE